MITAWYLLGDEIAAMAADATQRMLLLPDEWRRAGRFAVDADRVRFIATRALVRTMLSTHSGVAPGAIQLRAAEPQGRPEVDAPAEAAIWQFNATHTDGLVACVVAREVTVGIDAEVLRPNYDHARVARRFFAESEQMLLEARAPEERAHAFLDIWTLKESYLKARGAGLSLPLGQFAFDIRNDPPTVEFAPQMKDDAAAWQFHLSAPTDRHRLAVAIRRQTSPPLAVRVVPHPGTT